MLDERSLGQRVNAAETLDAAFAEALKSYGFERLNGEACSYILRRGDPPSDLHVDVEVLQHPLRFGVVLQDLRHGGQRRELLEAFEGLEGYLFEADQAESLERARAEAIEHLERYGIPWLMGQSVSTPALATRSALATRDRHRRLLIEAQASFHSGHRQQSRQALEEAVGISPLDPVSAKMLEMLRR